MSCYTLPAITDILRNPFALDRKISFDLVILILFTYFSLNKFQRTSHIRILRSTEKEAENEKIKVKVVIKFPNRFQTTRVLHYFLIFIFVIVYAVQCLHV